MILKLKMSLKVAMGEMKDKSLITPEDFKLKTRTL
jgi:hypothetical protein